MKWSLVKKSPTMILPAFIILTVIFIRLRFLDTPLERDEGEYAYIGQIILKGLLPYKDAVNLKFPGIFFIYSGILLTLPNTPGGIHTALLFTNMITALFLFFIAKRFFNWLTAVVTAISFIVMTLSPSIHGLWANSEHFVMLFVTAALLLILPQTRTWKVCFFAGLLLGIAALVKQHAALFLFFGSFYIGYSTIKSGSKKQLLHNEIGFFSGVSIPLLITALWLFQTENKDAFIFWTIKYAFEYATVTRIDPEIYRIFFRFFLSAPAALFMACVGIAGMFFHRRTSTERLFLLLFLGFSILAMSPGLLFRPHYYILLIPSLSLLPGAGVNSLFRYEIFRKRQPVVISLILLAIASPLFFNRTTFFRLSPRELSRQTYGANPFPESLRVASYLKDRTSPEERVAVIGSEPQIYFYADRVAATRYILTYPLMETHSFAAQMQREFIADLEESQPEYIVFVSVPTSWLRQEESPDILFDWFPGFINKSYALDGVVDIISDRKSIFIYGYRAAGYRPRSLNMIQIYKKRDLHR